MKPIKYLILVIALLILSSCGITRAMWTNHEKPILDRSTQIAIHSQKNTTFIGKKHFYVIDKGGAELEQLLTGPYSDELQYHVPTVNINSNKEFSSNITFNSTIRGKSESALKWFEEMGFEHRSFDMVKSISFSGSRIWHKSISPNEINNIRELNKALAFSVIIERGKTRRALKTTGKIIATPITVTVDAALFIIIAPFALFIHPSY